MLDYLKQLFKKPIRYNPIPEEQLSAYNNTRPQLAMGKLCHAPYESMVFQINGKVNSCCRNMRHAIGVYPAQSIREMWFGKGAQTIRDHIEHNDLTRGCDACALEIANGNYNWVHARSFDWVPKKEHDYPQILEFTIGNECNYECVMCHGALSSSIRKNREKLPPFVSVYDEQFVEQLKEFIPYAKQMNFLGGEPFMIDLNYMIWDMLPTLNPDAKLTVTTNGSIYNSKVRSIVEGGNFNLNFSIDSLVKDNLEAIRVNAKFDRVVANLMRYHEFAVANDRETTVVACLMKQNLQDIPELFTFCNKHEIILKFNIVNYPTHSAPYMLSLQKLRESLNKFNSVELVPQSRIQEQNVREFNDSIRAIESWCEQAEVREEGAGKHNAVAAGELSDDVELSTLDDTQIYEKFYHIVLEYIDNEGGLTQSQKTEKVDRIKATYNEAFDLIADENVLKKAFVNVDNIPTVWLITEGENGDAQVLAERIRAAANLN